MLTKKYLQVRHTINERGQGLAEVAIFLALVVIVAITTLTPLGTTIRDTFSSVTASL